MRNLEGKRFGDLSVIQRDSGTGKSKWICECSCGNVSSVFEHNLIDGSSTRCNNWQRHPRAVKPCTSKFVRVGDAYKVECSDGSFFMVDYADKDLVDGRSWYLGSHGYFYTNIGRKKYSVHRLIMGAKVGEEVDHISQDKSDNRRCNLRFCTRSENQRNMGLTNGNKTGYKGVFVPKGSNKFQASIRRENRICYLGAFENKVEAAQAYNIAAILLHGKFGRLNPVPKPSKKLIGKIYNKVVHRYESMNFLFSEEKLYEYCEAI
ncbi:HNH endonuclease [Enterococcus hirae]|nr:HNH endonuclease [Enterococcus hirae]